METGPSPATGTEPLVTVFGGTGFLGSRLVSRFRQAGWRVRVAARHAPPDSGGFVTADVRSPQSVAAACAGAGAVCNAVGLYVEHGADTFDAVHVGGAGNVAQEARRAGARCLLHVSGIGASPGSTSRYVRARAAGERAVREAFPGATVLRPSVLLGGGADMLHAVEAMTRRAPVVPLFGRGETRLQPVHADDVARAAAHLAAARDERGRTWELGGAEIMTWREIVAAVLAHHGRRRVLLPVPFPAWRMLAQAMSPLPAPPLTPDQVELMRHDNVTAPGMAGFAELGIAPRGLQEVLAALARQ